MKKPKRILIFLFVLTLFTIFLNIPSKIDLSFKTPFFSLKQSLPGLPSTVTVGNYEIQREFPFRKGLDLEGGTSVTLRAHMDDIPQSQQEAALDSAKNVIERRVNLYGVSEPVIQTAKVGKDHRIIVEIPGVTDVNQAISLIGSTAKLSFWEEVASGSGTLRNASSSAYPLGIVQLFGENAAPTNLGGGDLQKSAVTFNAQTGKPEVQLTFTPDGSKKFATITRRNVGKIVAIVLDTVVIEAPQVNEPILGGSAVISGAFTTEQAKALQIQLNAGALPVSLSVLEQHAVGATLGQQSLEKSLFAGTLGFLIIVIFMWALYGRLGLIASMALTLYVLLVLTLFRLIPVTLTLAGIAGFILSIGIAVDANILIFERMREEIRSGKSRSTALNLGFTKAWDSIRDSNMASLITSAVLYYFGTGAIRGFALTLALGVFVSLFSAVFVTRTLLKVFYKTD